MKRRRKGTGTIENAAGGRKRARIPTPTGRRDLGTFDTVEEAETMLNAARAVLTDGHHVEGVTLGIWAQRVLDRREAEGYRSADSDWSRWRAHLERAGISQLAVKTVVKADVLEWLDVMAAKKAADRRGRRKLGRQTIQNALNLLRAVLEDAVQRGLIADNPARGVRVPRRVVSTEDPWTWLEPWEQDAIYRCEAIPLHARLWMAFAWGTGLREGEQFNLRLGDVFLASPRPYLVVRRGSAKHGPKDTRAHRSTRSKIRRVPLFGIGLEALGRWLDMLPRYCKSNPLGLVFPGPTGARKPIGKPLHVTRRPRPRANPVPVNPMPEYLAAAGITPERRHDGRAVRWHDLRHTCAASLVSGWWGRRWSLGEVRSLLGHTSVTVTERYAHLADSALQSAAAETAWGGSPVEGPNPPGGHKPVISPKSSADRAVESLVTTRNHSESHLRDLNPRPTVYETVGFTNNAGDLNQRQAPSRARGALQEIAGGGHALAGALLVELVAGGHEGAAAALAEVAAGRWGLAVELFATMAAEAGEAAPLRAAGGAS